jgi:hypothetical protein
LCVDLWGSPLFLTPVLPPSFFPYSTHVQGRSYKYYAGPVLYPFGFGLSYTTFALSGDCPSTSASPQAWSLPPGTTRAALRAGAGGNTSCSVTVKNTGTAAGDEVVMVFVSPGASAKAAAQPDPLAIKRLVGFQRVSLGAGENITIPFTFDPTALAEVNGEGDRVIYQGDYTFTATRGHGEEVQWPVKVLLSPGDTSLLVRRYPRL